jgi:hypothetical protein
MRALRGLEMQITGQAKRFGINAGVCGIKPSGGTNAPA